MATQTVVATPNRSSKLTLSFGLVNVPVSMKPLADPKKAVSGKYTCAQHGPGLTQQYVCGVGEKHEHVVDEKVLSYPHPDDSSKFVILDNSVIAEFTEERTGFAQIDMVIDADTIDPAYFEQVYLVWPGDGGDLGFDLFTSVLRNESKAAVCTTVLSKRTRILVFRWSSEFDCLLGHVVRFDSELRHKDVSLVQSGAESRGTVDKAQYEVAKQLLDALAGDFDPTEVTDTYTELMQAAIRSAAGGKPIETTAVKPKPTADLMETLLASIEASSGAKPKSTAKPRKRVKAS